MIGHDAYGPSFAALADYLERGEDGLQEGRIAWFEPRNVWAPTVRDAAAVMSLLAAASPTSSPVYHLSVSFDPADPATRELMLRVADRLRSDLGLEDHQALIVAHGDRAHAHFHLLVNRVHPRTGRVWKIDFSRREVERSLRIQERELGLRESPGHLFQLPGQERPDRSVSVGAGVLRREERTGERPYVETARAEIAGDLAAARSYEELDALLAAKGHWIEARARGLVVTDGRGYAAVSSVSPTASHHKLERRFGKSFAEHLSTRESGTPGSRSAGYPDRAGTRERPAPGSRGDGEHPGLPGAGNLVAAGTGSRGSTSDPAARGPGWPGPGGARRAGGSGGGSDRAGGPDGDGRGAGGDLGAPGAAERPDGGAAQRRASGGDRSGATDGGGAGQRSGDRRADGPAVPGSVSDHGREPGRRAPARGAGDEPRAGARRRAVEAPAGLGGGSGQGGTRAPGEARLEGVGLGGRPGAGDRPAADAPAPGLDDERGAAAGTPGRRGGDLHVRAGHSEGTRGDAAREPLAGAAHAGLDRSGQAGRGSIRRRRLADGRHEDAELADAVRGAGRQGVPVPSTASTVAATAAQVAARRTLRLRVEEARSDLARTSRLVEDLSRAVAAADLPLVRFRTALRQLYGAQTFAAEHGFRRLVLEQGVEQAVALVREDPRALLPGPRARLAGGASARARVTEQATLCAPVVAQLDRTLGLACDHAGLPRPHDHADSVGHRRATLDHLQHLAQSQRAVLQEALDDYRHVTGILATQHQLRSEWTDLNPSQRAAVRLAVPDVDRLLEPRSTGLHRGDRGRTDL